MKTIKDNNNKRTISHCSWRIFGKIIFSRVVTPHRWIHYKVSDYALFGFVAACGAKKPMCEHPRTQKLNEITCPRCVDVLKMSNWHCPEHGFIDSIHVTNDEKCDICGSKLNQDAPQNAKEQNGHIAQQTNAVHSVNA
jgi:hypothetical protein